MDVAQCTPLGSNCWTTRRCCSGQCVTKANNVIGYAQCRDDGCTAICGWECRILSAESVATRPKFGAGSESWKHALRRMLTPWRFNSNASLPPSGNSLRLGTVVDAWLFASLSGDQRTPMNSRLVQLVNLLCHSPPSLGRYIGTQLGQLSMPDGRRAALMASAKRLHIGLSGASVGLYSHAIVRTLVRDVRPELRRLLSAYASRYDPSLEDQRYVGGATHLIVHYRVGDFVQLGVCISVEAVARSAATLRPSVVELLDGGGTTDSSTTFNSTHRSNFVSFPPSRSSSSSSTSRQFYAERAARTQASREQSAAVIARLRAALEAALPNAQHIDALAGRSTDADFYRMVHAPLLLTAGGSFAIAAAVASYAAEVRTPAARDYLHTNKGQYQPEQVAPGWQTYSFGGAVH